MELVHRVDLPGTVVPHGAFGASVRTVRGQSAGTAWPKFKPGDDLSGSDPDAFFVRDAAGKYQDIAAEVGLGDPCIRGPSRPLMWMATDAWIW